MKLNSYISNIKLTRKKNIYIKYIVENLVKFYIKRQEYNLLKIYHKIPVNKIIINYMESTKLDYDKQNRLMNLSKIS